MIVQADELLPRSVVIPEPAMGPASAAARPPAHIRAVCRFKKAHRMQDRRGVGSRTSGPRGALPAIKSYAARVRGTFSRYRVRSGWSNQQIQGSVCHARGALGSARDRAAAGSLVDSRRPSGAAIRGMNVRSSSEDHPNRVGHLLARPAYVEPSEPEHCRRKHVSGRARALTPGDERCGMAGPSRDNALDHAVVVVSGNRSGYRVPAIMPPRAAEGEV